MAEYTETLADGTSITYQPSASSPTGYKRIITPPAKVERKGLFGSKPKAKPMPMPMQSSMGTGAGMQTSGAGAAASNSMFAGLQAYGGGGGGGGGGAGAGMQTSAAGAADSHSMFARLQGFGGGGSAGTGAPTMNPPAGVAGTMYAPSALPPRKKGLFGGGASKVPVGSRPLPNPDIPPIQPYAALNTGGDTYNQPRLLPSLYPTTTETLPAMNAFMRYPADYASLSWLDKWRWNSMRRNFNRAVKALARAEEERDKEARKEQKKLLKIQRKHEKAIRKEEIRQLRHMQRHPQMARPLPPSQYKQALPMQGDPSYMGYNAQVPTTQPAATWSPDYKSSLPMLPKPGEFGIRRPLDGPGQPTLAWPGMSRTLALAHTEAQHDLKMTMAGRGQIYETPNYPSLYMR